MLSPARRRHASRGQAMFETAIMMPLFLVGLFGTFWAVREAALSERMQEGVRYGGLVSVQANPYTSYSLYAMYSLLDGGALPLGTRSCSVDLGPSITAGRSSFWLPATPATYACTPTTSLVSSGSSQNILLQDVLLSDNATAPVTGYLASTVLRTTTTPVSAVQNYFRSPDVGTLMSCSNVGADLKVSLEGGADTTTPTTAATPMPFTIPATTVFPAPLTCATFGAAPPATTGVPLASPSPTATPTPPPSTPSPPPTPTPTPTPSPTATPTPRPTPTPTPTPVPCFDLFGIIIVCPTPTPRPTPTPTMSPPPPTPTASPSPCNNGNGNGHGYGNCSTPSPAPTPMPTATTNPYSTPPGGLTG